MDKLYRKRTLPSGRVRYEETHEWNTGGDPAEGLWVVRRNGQSRTWINYKIADIPLHVDIAWVAGQIDVIAEAIHAHRDRSTYEAAIAVINALMEAHNDHT